jgi:hypothetical protein
MGPKQAPSLEVDAQDVPGIGGTDQDTVGIGDEGCLDAPAGILKQLVPNSA